MVFIDEMLKDCGDLAKQIDAAPDYPIQLTFMDGVFCAMCEPNYDSIIQHEADNSLDAVCGLKLKLIHYVQAKAKV